MQINNQISASQFQPIDKPLELKQGEIYSAQIKERVSDTEAVLQIRGKEVKATFEGKLPAEDRVTVQITGQKEQSALVKTISADTSKTSSLSQSSEVQVLQSVGITAKDVPELKQSVQILLDKGVPVTKEAVQELRNFFEKSEGTAVEKLDTVKALANKRLEVTQSHLHPIHEALHGKPLNEVLIDLAKELDPDFDLAKNERATAQKSIADLKTATADIPENQNIVIEKGTDTSSTDKKTSQSTLSNRAQIIEIIRNSRELIEQEPDLKKAVEKVREEIIRNPKIDRDVARKIEKATFEAEKLQSIGKERLVQALKTAEDQLVQKETQTKAIQSSVQNTSTQSMETKSVAMPEGKLSDIINEVKSEVLKTPNLQRSIDKLQSEILENTQIPKEVTDKLRQAISEVRTLQNQGRITTGREVLVDALATAVKEVETIEASKTKTSQTQGNLLTTEQPASEVVKQVKEEVQRDPNIQRVVEKVREQVVNNPKVDLEVAEKIEKAVNEARQLQQIGREGMGRERLTQALEQAEQELKQIEGRQQQQPKVEQQVDSRQSQSKVEQQAQTDPARGATVQPASEIVKQVKEEMQRDPNLQRAVEKVREQVVNNPKVDLEVAEKIEKAVNEARQLQQIGREGMGRERLSQALEQAEQELKQIEARQQQQPKVEQQVESRNQHQTKVEQQAQTDPARRATEQPASETVKQVKEEIQRDPNLQRAVEKVREQVVNNPKVDLEVAEKIEKAVNEARQLQQIGREGMGRERLSQALEQAEQELKQIEARQQQQPKVEQQVDSRQQQQAKVEQQAQTELARRATEQPASEMVKQVKEEMQRDPNLQRTVEKVREQVVNNPKVDIEVAEKIERAVNEARQLQQIGREGMGRERLTQALEQAEQELKQIETRQQQHPKVEQQVDSRQQQQPKVEQQVDSRQQQAQTEPTRQATEQPASEIVKQVKEEIQRDPNLQRVVEKVREQVVNNPKVDLEVAEKIEKAVSEARQLQQIGREGMGRERLTQALEQAEQELKQIEARQQQQPKVEQQVDSRQQQQAKVEQQVQTEPTRRANEQPVSEIVKQVKEEIQRDPNLQRAVEKVREQVVNNPKVDLEVAEKIEKAVNEARQLQQIGREGMGRERLTQALEQAEQELKQIETRQQQQPKVDQQVDSRQQQSKVEQQVDSRQQQPKVEQQAQTEPTRRATEQPASAIVKQVKEEVQRDPNLQRAVEKVREQVVNNPKVDLEVVEKIEKAVNEARQLQQIGREGMGRERLTQALEQAEKELKQIEVRQQQQPKVDQQQVESRNQQQQSKVDQQAQTVQSLLDSQSIESQASEVVKQVKEEIQREPNMQRVLEKVQNLIANTKNVDPEIMRNIERIANQANQLDQAGRERITKVLEQIEHALKQVEDQTATIKTQVQIQNEQQVKGQPISNTQNQQQQLNNAIDKLMQNLENEIPTQANEKSPIESIKQALTQIQKEPNLEQALTQIRQEITSNPNMDLKTVDKVEKAIESASQLKEKGRELAARQQITNALTEIEKELPKAEPNQATDQQQAIQDELRKQFEQNEQFQTLSLESKNILVTRVTQKLAQATHDFRELKREITRNLDNVERLINTFKKSAYPQVKQVLETTISKLDNAILKSDVMLFTDMKTEKQLMQASSQLADAKKLLAKGNHTEAAKIVHDIKTLIDKINFKPTEQKVMHYVSKESMNLEQRSPSQQMLNHFDETARSYVRQEPSARQMFETVKSLGLNHDSDLAKALVFQKGGGDSSQQDPNQQNQQNQQQQQNLKEALLKLAQTSGDDQNTKVAQQADQALNNLTGQQLLSKSDAGNTLQSMFFNLPFLLGEKPENLQVYINSKKEGQQVDWENCSLYFLLETKKLGDVGIMLSSTERNLSITIKNDKPGFKEKMEPIATITKEKLQEVGYNVNSINFTRMTPINSHPTKRQETTNTQQEAKQSRPVFTEKGMDFKI